MDNGLTFSLGAPQPTNIFVFQWMHSFAVLVLLVFTRDLYISYKQNECAEYEIISIISSWYELRVHKYTFLIVLPSSHKSRKSVAFGWHVHFRVSSFYVVFNKQWLNALLFPFYFFLLRSKTTIRVFEYTDERKEKAKEVSKIWVATGICSTIGTNNNNNNNNNRILQTVIVRDFVINFSLARHWRIMLMMRHTT